MPLPLNVEEFFAFRGKRCSEESLLKVLKYDFC